MTVIILAAISMMGAFATIFFYAPVEATQGMVQKIFYIHVPSALTMYVGFFIGFLASLLYLLEKKSFWDEIAVSAIEIGYFFCTLVLLTGPIWGKPIWGAWWVWDPRLTTTLLLWLLYSGYLILRGYFGRTAQGRTVTSIVAIIAFLDVPLIHFSVKLWRGIHPSVMASKDNGMTPKMKLTLAVVFMAMVFLFSALMAIRFRLERALNRAHGLRLRQMENA